MMSPRERRVGFEVIVLEALWLIIRLLVFARRDAGGAGSHAEIGQTHVRADMLGYMDQVGLQTEGARNYRREKTFPELPYP